MCIRDRGISTKPATGSHTRPNTFLKIIAAASKLISGVPVSYTHLNGDKAFDLIMAAKDSKNEVIYQVALVNEIIYYACLLYTSRCV